MLGIGGDPEALLLLAQDMVKLHQAHDAVVANVNAIIAKGLVDSGSAIGLAALGVNHAYLVD